MQPVTVTDFDEVFRTPRISVAVTATVKFWVDAHVKGFPVPLVTPFTVQVNEKGGVPPVVMAVKVTSSPGVTLDGPLIVTEMKGPAALTVTVDVSA